MPTLIMNDGKRIKVGYGKAAKIKSVLEGKEEPETPEQEEFVSTVANIDWSDLPSRDKTSPATGPVGSSQRAKEIHEINKTPGLTVREKFKRVRALFSADKEEPADDSQIP